MRVHWIWPTFFLGISISRHFGYYAIGLGFVSISYDRVYNDMFKGKLG